MMDQGTNRQARYPNMVEVLFQVVSGFRGFSALIC